MHLTESKDYEDILLNNSGLLDVRAPVEFFQGAFPNAKNLPILNDSERQQVGICYKNKGQHQAIQFGHELVDGEIKQQRVEQWVNYVKHQTNPYLYCYRGGLRSKISQLWLHDSGIDIPRVKGGYKALRHYLLQQIEASSKRFNFILVGGLTGCRKTHLINLISNGIDLEGAANHRGSSFGAHANAQNSQIDFEHKLALDLLNAYKTGLQTIVLEDESRFIGSVDIPKNIFSKMRASPMIVVESSQEIRLQQLLKEYVIDMENEFTSIYEDPDFAFQQFSQYLLKSLQRIRKRLGSQRWENLSKDMHHALYAHQSQRDIQGHLKWLTPLLNDYYDPMYTSQLSKRRENIIFRGNFNACGDFLNLYNPTLNHTETGT